MPTVSITQEADGSYVIQEQGQSPQKLGSNWEDLETYLQGQFLITHAEPEPNPFDHDGDGKAGGSKPRKKG